MRIIFRKFFWKLGRRMYMYARSEPRINLPNDSGEGFVQESVVACSTNSDNLVVFDVGANVGQWTLQLLSTLHNSPKAFQNVNIFSFEPVPKTREKLEENLAENQEFATVNVQSIALSDKLGHFEMMVWEDLAGTNSLTYDEKDKKGAKETIFVETNTIDRFCSDNGITHINLLKCDTEGHDFKVLQGAEGMIKQGSIDAIQFEYNHRWIPERKYLKDVFDLIEGTDYIFTHVRAGILDRIDTWHPELERYFESNYLLVHKRAESWFNIHNGKFDQSNVYT